MVYTNTAILAYDPSIIRSLLSSHWSTTRLWVYTNTAALANNPPVWRLSSPSCGHINRLCSGHQHRRLVLWPDCLRYSFAVALTIETTIEVNITVASAYEPSVQMSWSPSPCTTIRLWWSFSRCRVTKGFGGDTLLSLPHNTYSDGVGRLHHQWQ